MRNHSEYHAECSCGEQVIRETDAPFTCAACGRRCEIAWSAAERDPREPVARTIGDDEEAAA